MIPNWLWQSLNQGGSPLGQNRPLMPSSFRSTGGRPMGARPVGFDVVNDISRRIDFLAKSVEEAMEQKDDKRDKPFLRVYYAK